MLLVLRQIGIDPADPRVRASIAKVAANTTWENDGQAFFDGEVEPCINGVVVGLGAYFGRDVDGVVARLLDDQLPDGGWNCEVENGATVSSVHSTICVLEGLLLHERATGGSPASIAARERGAGVPAGAPAVPAQEHGRADGPRVRPVLVPDPLALRRAAGARLLPRRRRHARSAARRGRRDGPVQAPAGRHVVLENTHAGTTYFAMEDGDGEPSRWNTLRALRVLRWWDGATTG